MIDRQLLFLRPLLLALAVQRINAVTNGFRLPGNLRIAPAGSQLEHTFGQLVGLFRLLHIRGPA